MLTTNLRRSAARPVLAATVATLLACSGAAQATAYTTYASAADFASAAPGLTTYTFEDGNHVLESRPYVVGTLGFSTLQHFTHPYLEDDGTYGAGVTYLGLEGIPGVNAAMQPQVDGVYAMSFDLGTWDGADSITVKVDYYNTVETITTGDHGASTFFGIISSDPIVQISFTASSGTEIDILDFTAGPLMPAVPEPASVSMALAGLGLLGLVKRRRRA